MAAYRYTLVIGPDSTDRAWLEGILMRGGLEVAACTEPELLAMADIVPPQVVVVDDSRAVARDETERRRACTERIASLERIRAHPALVGVPFVVVAPDADLDSFSAVIERGGSAYLVKPAAAEEVVRIVHKISGWLSSADHTERRRRLRHPLVMAIEVSVAGRDPVAGQIVDASSTGCRIELRARVAKGDAVRLTLLCANGSTDLALTGEVRWRREAADGAELAGVRFTGTAALFAGKVLGAGSRRGDPCT